MQEEKRQALSSTPDCTSAERQERCLMPFRGNHSAEPVLKHNMNKDRPLQIYPTLSAKGEIRTALQCKSTNNVKKRVSNMAHSARILLYCMRASACEIKYRQLDPAVNSIHYSGAHTQWRTVRAALWKSNAANKTVNSRSEVGVRREVCSPASACVVRLQGIIEIWHGPLAERTECGATEQSGCVRRIVVLFKYQHRFTGANLDGHALPTTYRIKCAVQAASRSRPVLCQLQKDRSLTRRS
eukprot:IDg2551t1